MIACITVFFRTFQHYVILPCTAEIVNKGKENQFRLKSFNLSTAGWKSWIFACVDTPGLRLDSLSDVQTRLPSSTGESYRLAIYMRYSEL